MTPQETPDAEAQRERDAHELEWWRQFSMHFDADGIPQPGTALTGWHFNITSDKGELMKWPGQKWWRR